MARCNGGILSAGMPAIERASACAPSPAALTTLAAAMHIGAGPPVSITTPFFRRARRAPAFRTRYRAMGLGVAPQREHIGVGVDDPGRGRQQRPLSLERGLERARSWPVSQTRSATPLASAWALSAASLSTSPAFTATSSLPHRLWGTPKSWQNAYSSALPSTQSRVFTSPVG